MNKSAMGYDQRVVLTLDAGGTNFVFSAMRGNQELVAPIRKASHANDLDRCLANVIGGFQELRELLDEKVVAISFAFPGPADYAKGIIGDLPNFPAFAGGVPLGPMLEDRFGIPVFINNDGNLFAYGESIAGYLPWLNGQIEEAGGSKSFTNLVGFTLGTGFGSGIVLGETMVLGQNTSGAEIHNTLNPFRSDWNAEEGVSTRAIQRVYASESGSDFNDKLMPGDIYQIAMGKKEGDRGAAMETFSVFGTSLGGSIANTLSLFDGIVVLGGGVSAAWDLFSPSMFKEISRFYVNFRGEAMSRLSYQVFNLEDDKELKEFSSIKSTKIQVPGSGRTVEYDALPRTGVGLSKIGASKSIALGAYAYALQQLDM